MGSKSPCTAFNCLIRPQRDTVCERGRYKKGVRASVCVCVSVMYCLGILIANLQNISCIYGIYFIYISCVMCVLSCRQNKQVIKLNCKAIRAAKREEKQQKKMAGKIFVSCTYAI